MIRPFRTDSRTISLVGRDWCVRNSLLPGIHFLGSTPRPESKERWLLLRTPQAASETILTQKLCGVRSFCIMLDRHVNLRFGFWPDFRSPGYGKERTSYKPKVLVRNIFGLSTTLLRSIPEGIAGRRGRNLCRDGAFQPLRSPEQIG